MCILAGTMWFELSFSLTELCYSFPEDQMDVEIHEVPISIGSITSFISSYLCLCRLPQVFGARLTPVVEALSISSPRNE